MPWGISQVRKVLFTIHIIFKLYPGESTLDSVIESKVPVKNRGEDAFHGLLVKRLNADDIQVAQKARGHHVASSSRRSHRAQHQDILQFQNTGVLSVRKKDMHVMLKTLWRCLRQLWGELRRYLCSCRAGCCSTADAITS